MNILSKNKRLKVLLTTAVLYEKHRKFVEQDRRIAQYRRAVERLRKNNSIELFCVECVHPGPYTFLNDYFDDDHILYARQHNRNIMNQGVDEFLSLCAALIHWKFNPSEMVCKLTGRYNVLDNAFFDITIKNEQGPHPFNALFRSMEVGDKYAQKGQLFTGLFSIRMKLFIDYLSSVNYQLLEDKEICIERDMYLWFQRQYGEKIEFVDDVNVRIDKGEEIWTM